MGAFDYVTDAMFNTDILLSFNTGYYEREGELWRAQLWTDNIAPELVAAMRAGLPLRQMRSEPVLRRAYRIVLLEVAN